MVQKLKSELGLWKVTFCGVGIIIGAGIYALIGEAAGLSGNLVWLSFILAALAASTTGLSYAELSSMFPKAGAEYEYTSKAFGKRIAFIIGLLTIFAGIIGSAAVSLGFGGYINALIGTPIIFSAILLVIILSIIIFLGIKKSAGLAVVFTIAAMIGLGSIIIFGASSIGSINYFEIPIMGLGGIVSAAALIFFAFIGFDSIVNLAEDTKNASKTIPKAVILAIIISTLIYVLVSIVAISVIPWNKLALSKAPLVDVMYVLLGENAAYFLGLVALFATASTVLLLLIAMSRLVFGMARSSALPKILSKIFKKTGSPYLAILIIGIITILFILFGKISFVANLTNFSIFIIFIFINLSAIKLRYKNKTKREFKIPLNIGQFPIIPFIGTIICFYLLLNVGFDVLLYGFVLLIICALIEKILRKKQAK